MPTISVIIPTYNRSHVLPNAIQSVLNQTYEDWELIVVDDGSGDDTKEVIKPYLKDNRIFYFYQENKGVSAARNYGASMANGKYLVFLDSDDLVETNWLFDFWDLVCITTKVHVVFCGIEVRKLHLGTTKVEIPSKRLRKSGMDWGLPIPGSFLVEKNVFWELGGYDEKLKFSENTDMLIRMQFFDLEFTYTDNVNLVYLQNEKGGNSILSNKIDSIEYLLNKHQIFFSQFKKNKRSLFQILVVSCLKLKMYSNSRKWFLPSIKIAPLNLKVYLRYIISYFPFVVGKVYG
ncbi:glycosyltransferase involved in cell wall biosynthesis [Algoriphagus sp. 4150]|uniref:glycosyltransferase family 2 protein n=1 Tax=Algoriphagus sp. 4150 TaxID=2817756 RepID=UPI0028588D84|nr:glycosyltransferase family 2 protein [Algoriphagus sp. 4150]MDR7127724.1 glycosyltransferase involved in cell wall biosynthesis [Algoriphagus sp. 4150]